MARFTSLEFMEALGLGYFDYNGAKTLLRMLTKNGIAKEVDKISPKGKGRKMVVYEIPDEFTLSIKPPETMPCHPPKKKRQEEEDEALTHQEIADEVAPSVVESTECEVVPTVSSESEYEDIWDE